MAQNNAHMEPQERRLERFRSNPPAEIIETLLNSIDNFFNNEIRLTTENDNYQSSLLFLGIHAVALTVAEGFWDKRGSDGYKIFLETYVDGDNPDTKFSTISQTIHDWRNVLAHQWIGSSGHSVGYDYRMNRGWELRDSITYVNPKIYRDQYLAAFSTGGKMWAYDKLFTADELEIIKARLIKKYQEN